MNSNRGRKEVALVASGIMLGATLAAPVAGVALTAQQSSQKIVVDGKSMKIEAYSIGGNNYCKLRDVGKAAGFAVAHNALGGEPDAWRDGKPLFKIYAEIPLEYEPYTGVFWPWRAEEITKAVHALPNTRYYVDAYDEYHSGVYLCTRYMLMQI